MTARTFRWLAFAAAFLVPPAAFGEKGSFDRTLDVSGPVRLEITAGSGSITVTPGAAGMVRVHGEIRTRSRWLGLTSAAEKVRRIEENPPVELVGDVLRVGRASSRGDDEDLFDGVSISYEVVVPEETAVVAKSGSGSLDLRGVRGPVDAKSGSGSVTVGSIGGDVTAKAGSGSVKASAVSGSLDAKTGSGSITARDVRGSMTATSGSGAIELESTGDGDVEAQASSGRVEVRGVRAGLDVRTSSGSISVEGSPLAAWRLKASSGSVSIVLPPEAAFDLDARTRSGSIDSDHPLTVSGRLSTKELRGSVRGGGPPLEVATSSGSIRIR